MTNRTSENTPMITRQTQSKRKFEEDKLTKATYRAAIVSLMYLAGKTRLYIAFAGGKLARCQNNPTEDDWEDVKTIFRYFQGSLKLRL